MVQLFIERGINRGSIHFFKRLLLFCLIAQNSLSVDLSPQEILQAARLRPTTHPIELSGELRGREVSLPLTLIIEKGTLRYQLHDPEETILLTLGQTSSLLEDCTSNGSSFSEAKRYQEIRNTGVTYDDLSLAFLYWLKPRVIKKELLRGMNVAVIELSAPPSKTDSKSLSTSSPYGSARLWVDVNTGTPLRMEGFDHQGRLLKRFEIISAQKIENLWMLKEMRIETFDPLTQKVIQRCYFCLSQRAVGRETKG